MRKQEAMPGLASQEPRLVNERKFVGDLRDLPFVLSLLDARLLPDRYHETGRINSVYLDTPGLRAWREKDDGDDIVQSLRSLQVEKLDLVILTHFDKDHIGGFAKVADAIPMDRVLMPDYVRDSEHYAALEASLQKHAIAADRLSEDTAFELGRAAFTVWTSTKTYDPEKGNDNQMSLVAAIRFDQIRLLFMGDAEGSWLNDLCNKGYELGCDILKFPYHGNWQKHIPALLALSLPQYAILTDSEKNPADIRTLDALKTLDITILRTIDGDVHLFTDGKKVTVR